MAHVGDEVAPYPFESPQLGEVGERDDRAGGGGVAEGTRGHEQAPVVEGDLFRRHGRSRGSPREQLAQLGVADHRGGLCTAAVGRQVQQRLRRGVRAHDAPVRVDLENAFGDVVDEQRELVTVAGKRGGALGELAHESFDHAGQRMDLGDARAGQAAAGRAATSLHRATQTFESVAEQVSEHDASEGCDQECACGADAALDQESGRGEQYDCGGYDRTQAPAPHSSSSRGRKR